MGMFLSLSGVIGKSTSEVAGSLSDYAKSTDGGLEQTTLPSEDNHRCIIEQGHGGTTIFYPDYYLEWDESSAFLSEQLKAPVFSCHIHDGDLWMYTLYVNGEIVDQFNPIPDYWQEDITEEELASWKGNATTVAKYVPGLRQQDIENYLVRWDLEAEESSKAYPDDEHMQEDWQLLDFLKKLGLPYPIDDIGNTAAQAQIYRFWTKELPLSPAPQSPVTHTPVVNNRINKKSWWKFW